MEPTIDLIVSPTNPRTHSYPSSNPKKAFFLSPGQQNTHENWSNHDDQSNLIPFLLARARGIQVGQFKPNNSSRAVRWGEHANKMLFGVFCCLIIIVTQKQVPLQHLRVIAHGCEIAPPTMCRVSVNQGFCLHYILIPAVLGLLLHPAKNIFQSGTTVRAVQQNAHPQKTATAWGEGGGGGNSLGSSVRN